MTYGPASACGTFAGEYTVNANSAALPTSTTAGT